MATQAELQKAVDDTTATASEARGTWKAAIPGPDAPKMTDDEQAEVDVLEEVFLKAKAARKAAERALAEWSPPAPAPAAPTGGPRRLASGVIVNPGHPAYNFGKPF